MVSDQNHKLDRKQVLHIAELAKVALTEQEVERLAEQLSEILDYFEILDRLDTSAIPPTAQPLPLCNVTRPDEVEPSMTPDEVLANAPQREDGHFRVEPILE
jgi:aspartyl-tRNA(Asn)/glutamyl-tRNA(Gln) amidotransferase subunit C